MDAAFVCSAAAPVNKSELCQFFNLFIISDFQLVFFKQLLNILSCRLHVLGACC